MLRVVEFAKAVRTWRLAVSLGLMLSVGAGLGWASYSSRGGVYRVAHPRLLLEVDGRQSPIFIQPTESQLRQWLRSVASADASAMHDKLLFTGTDYRPHGASRLGFELDVAATLDRIRELRPRMTWLRRLRQARSPASERLELAGVYRLNEASARAELERLASSYYRAPVDAHLDVSGYRRVAHVLGRALDVEATLEQLRVLPADEATLELVFRDLQPTVRNEDLPAVDVSQVLAHFETDFSRKRGRRVTNIRRAAELLDGHVIQPGEMFSFNDVVGDRTLDNGFITAPVIVNDMMEDGVGGGVCQVASTLHGAAVHGGLQVKSRRSHSRPSGYAPLGLDATVIYGEVDLQLKNIYDVPLMIHVKFPSRYVIRVELRGLASPAKVEHQYAVLKRYDFIRRVIEDPSLAAGEVKRTQKGGYGYDVVSTVKTKLDDGSVRKRRYPSKYYPVPEIFHVGPGTSFQDLPALPKGATHVESVPLTTASADISPDVEG